MYDKFLKTLRANRVKYSVISESNDDREENEEMKKFYRGFNLDEPTKLLI